MNTIKSVSRNFSIILVLLLSLMLINACGGGNNGSNNDQSPFDTEAPSKPAGLSVNVTSSSQVNLSWVASIDNVGVQGYKAYRNGSYLKSVSGSPTSDTGLSANTQYCYTVKAYDAAGNESVASNQQCDTTLSNSETSPPSTPANLQATVISTSEISLSWTASIDNVAIAGYRVYRDGTLAGSPSTTSFDDTGLSANTNYCYTVEAYDAAGNDSEQSNSECTTTLVISSPINVSTIAGLCEITIQWDSVQGADTYNLYWSSEAGVSKNSYEGLESGITDNSYIHRGLLSTETYYYVVTAENTNGESIESTEVSDVLVDEQVLVSDLVGSYLYGEMAVDSNYLYFTSTSHNVGKVPITGGEITMLYSSSRTHDVIAVDSTHVYFADCGNDYCSATIGDPATIRKVSKEGGSDQVVTIASPRDMAVDDDYIYYTEMNGTTVKKISKDGSNLTTLISFNDSGPFGITLDSSNVYFISHNILSTVYKMSKNGDNLTSLAVHEFPKRVAVDDSYVYFTTSGSLYTGTVSKVSKSGGSIITLASGLNNPIAIALDNSNVYFHECGTLSPCVGSVANGSVSTVSKIGGEVTLFDSTSITYRNLGLAVDDTAVYYVDNGRTWQNSFIKKMLTGTCN